MGLFGTKYNLWLPRHLFSKISMWLINIIRGTIFLSCQKYCFLFLIVCLDKIYLCMLHFSFGLIQQLLQGNIPLRHLLNEETLFIFWWRSAIKKVNLSNNWITSRDSIELCIVWSDDGLFCFTKETKLFLTPNYSGMREKCEKFRTLTLQSPNRYLGAASCKSQ